VGADLIEVSLMLLSRHKSFAQRAFNIVLCAATLPTWVNIKYFVEYQKQTLVYGERKLLSPFAGFSAKDEIISSVSKLHTEYLYWIKNVFPLGVVQYFFNYFAKHKFLKL